MKLPGKQLLSRYARWENFCSAFLCYRLGFFHFLLMFEESELLFFPSASHRHGHCQRGTCTFSLHELIYRVTRLSHKCRTRKTSSHPLLHPVTILSALRSNIYVPTNERALTHCNDLIFETSPTRIPMLVGVRVFGVLKQGMGA